MEFKEAIKQVNEINDKCTHAIKDLDISSLWTMQYGYESEQEFLNHAINGLEGFVEHMRLQINSNIGIADKETTEIRYNELDALEKKIKDNKEGSKI